MDKTLLIRYSIVSSLLLVFLISFHMLSMGITSVFPHLFYIPLLLAAYYYPKQGIYIALTICFLYIIPVIFFFPADLIVISSALIRAAMFLIIAGLVSYIVKSSIAEDEEHEILLEFQNKIIENPQVVVTVADQEQNVIMWNTGAENISGYKKSEVLGKSDVWSRILPDSGVHEELKSRISDIVSNGDSVEGLALPMLRKDGKLRYMIVSLQPLNTKDGEHWDILTIGVDITEKRELEAGNKAALAQIEKNISQMYVLNDRIRNPLAVILGQAELDLQFSRQIICEQVIEINDIISQLDRDSMESTKILEYLRKHYDFFK